MFFAENLLHFRFTLQDGKIFGTKLRIFVDLMELHDEVDGVGVTPQM